MEGFQDRPLQVADERTMLLHLTGSSETENAIALSYQPMAKPTTNTSFATATGNWADEMDDLPSARTSPPLSSHFSANAVFLQPSPRIPTRPAEATRDTLIPSRTAVTEGRADSRARERRFRCRHERRSMHMLETWRLTPLRRTSRCSFPEWRCVLFGSSGLCGADSSV